MQPIGASQKIILQPFKSFLPVTRLPFIFWFDDVAKLAVWELLHAISFSAVLYTIRTTEQIASFYICFVNKQKLNCHILQVQTIYCIVFVHQGAFDPDNYNRHSLFTSNIHIYLLSVMGRSLFVYFLMKPFALISSSNCRQPGHAHPESWLVLRICTSSTTELLHTYICMLYHSMHLLYRTLLNLRAKNEPKRGSVQEQN